MAEAMKSKTEDSRSVRRRRIVRATMLVPCVLGLTYAWLAWRPTGLVRMVESADKSMGKIAAIQTELTASLPQTPLPPAPPAAPDDSKLVNDPPTTGTQDVEMELTRFLSAVPRPEMFIYPIPPAIDIPTSPALSSSIRQAASDPLAHFARARKEMRTIRFARNRYAAPATSPTQALSPEALQLLRRRLDALDGIGVRWPSGFEGPHALPYADLHAIRTVLRGDSDTIRARLLRGSVDWCSAWLKAQTEDGAVFYEQRIWPVLMRLIELNAASEKDLAAVDDMLGQLDLTAEDYRAFRAARANRMREAFEKNLDDKFIGYLRDSTINWMLGEKLEPMLRQPLRQVLEKDFEAWCVAYANQDEAAMNRLEPGIVSRSEWFNMGAYGPDAMDNPFITAGTSEEWEGFPNKQRIVRRHYGRGTIGESNRDTVDLARLLIAGARFRAQHGRWPESVEELRTAGLIPWQAGMGERQLVVIRNPAFRGPERALWRPREQPATSDTEQLFAKAVYDFQKANENRMPESAEMLGAYLSPGLSTADCASRFRDYSPETLFVVLSPKRDLHDLLYLAPKDRDLSDDEAEAILKAPPGWNLSCMIVNEEPLDKGLIAVLGEGLDGE